MPRTRSRSTACSTCSRTSTGRSWRHRTTKYKDEVAPPTARRSVRSTTTEFASAASRWRWSSRRSSRPRALRRRWSASNTTGRSMSPISRRSASGRVLARDEEKRRGAVHKPRQRREGIRAGGGASRSRISHAGRAPQSDGAVRGDGGLGRRRPAHRLRQDAGTAELPQLRRRRAGNAARQGARAVALCRRRIRIRPASAI